MKKMTMGHLLRPALLTLATGLSACTTGLVHDTSGEALTDVDVVAYGECLLDGCAANEVQTAVPGAVLTGYHTTTNNGGQFLYDAYGEWVPPENMMALRPAADSGATFYKMQLSKTGYQDIWLDFTPDFQPVMHEGKQFYITRVPDTFMCEDAAPDTDGDGICDEAEAHYGLSAESTDTDGDGLYDDQEVFGTGSPFRASTREFIHYNINVSNFDVSRAFYELLGAKVILETDVNVTDPAEAQGLDLPPYQLHAAPMIFSDGFIIDLIQFTSPYDPEPPHSEALSANGMTQLILKSENLVADVAKLGAAGISYTVTGTYGNGNPSSIELTDPDGLPVRILQDGPLNEDPNYGHGVGDFMVLVNDLEETMAFYKKLGFQASTYGYAPAVTLGGRKIGIAGESEDTAPAYEQLNHLGLARLAIKTTNIEQDIKILEDAGVEFYSSPITPSGTFGFLRYVCFEDPDGLVIELVEYLN